MSGDRTDDKVASIMYCYSSNECMDRSSYGSLAISCNTAEFSAVVLTTYCTPLTSLPFLRYNRLSTFAVANSFTAYLIYVLYGAQNGKTKIEVIKVHF